MAARTPSLLESLSGMPRVSAQGWRRLSWSRRYLIAARAAVLPLTVNACLFGGLLALPWTPEEGWRLLLVSTALVLAHATSNLVNDQVDWLVGLDRPGYFRLRYGAHPLAQGLMAPLTHGLLLVATGAAALLVGLAVCRMAGPPAYVLAGIGAVLLLAYTWPLKRCGFGELAVFLVWGPLIVGGVYWVVSGDWGPETAVLSAIAGLGPTVVVLAKHLDKLRDDRARGIRTLPVVLGPTSATRVLSAVAIVQVLGGLAWSWTSGRWAYALLLFALPACGALIRVSLRARPTARPQGYPADLWPLWYTAAAFRFARATGLALVAAALLDGIL